ENMAKYINKGSLLGIDGRIQTGQYDDSNGVRRYTTDVVCDSVQFLEPKNASPNNQDYGQQQDGYYRQDNNQQNRNQNSNQSNQQLKQQTPEIDVAEDDLPF
ncbi:MAG: single-stranded DNA-binding protein, partial [Candidatus Izimaplasma sp.]|nr:single-stranded DNA-binding protein [Candidatus Izimaplasma bacterium]